MNFNKCFQSTRYKVWCKKRKVEAKQSWFLSLTPALIALISAKLFLAYKSGRGSLKRCTSAWNHTNASIKFYRRGLLQHNWLLCLPFSMFLECVQEREEEVAELQFTFYWYYFSEAWCNICGTLELHFCTCCNLQLTLRSRNYTWFHKHSLFCCWMELWHNKQLFLTFVFVYMLSGKKTFTDLLNSLSYMTFYFHYQKLFKTIPAPACARSAQLLGIVCVTPEWFHCTVLYF